MVGAATLVICTAAVQADHRGTLTVSFLDVQGGAVLVQAPSGRTVLVDAGPDTGILRVLAGALPWWQRSLDVVVLAHPDAAHAGGFIDILERYRVKEILVSSAQGSGPVWQTLEKRIDAAKAEGMRVAVLSRGDIVDLGAGAYLEALFPDRDLSQAPSSQGCVELLLVYGDTSFMLACGNPAVETYLAALDGKQLHADVLYASATTSPLFAGFVGAQTTAQNEETFISDSTSIQLIK
jgi:competence protein ComEC